MNTKKILSTTSLIVTALAAMALGLWLATSAATEEKTGSDTASIFQGKPMKLNDLTPEEKRVIIDKGTERPFTGRYYNFHEDGTYTCKQCGAPLYKSGDKFDSGCGWPSFDDEIPGAVKRTTDADGVRTEITCANCGAHLGHVFVGEHFTDKNTRHCVNSISLNFVPASQEATLVSAKGEPESETEADKPVSDTAYYAGGCFWGVEYMLQQEEGVKSVVSGYMGGHVDNPTYEQVCTGTTGHAETVEVVFDPSKVSYEKLTKLFFEIHDPTQLNRQGPDRGYQYRSAVFYTDEAQKKTAEKLIGILKDKGYDVVTEVTKAGPFWKAENYHQDYYEGNGKQPYCHVYTKRF
jgi:peptide methionine sulfoxide reductase msrA/msrB